jgi:Icc protein
MPNSSDIEQLKPRSNGVLRLVQITDCHVFARAGERLRGMDTRRSFAAVLGAALARHAQLDLLLATGDLSEDGSAEAYDFLAGEFDATGIPTYWLPGNHDDPRRMREHFTAARVRAAKQIIAGGWLILLLDSTLPGEVRGRVGDAELAFLERSLRRHAELPTLVCLHHQAVDSGSRWIDEKGLQNGAELRARLARHDNVRAVLWGHVHQASWRREAGIEWMSTPSSCVQFKPLSVEFALSDETPGYRYLGLYNDGSISTSVHRIETGQFDAA